MSLLSSKMFLQLLLLISCSLTSLWGFSFPAAAYCNLPYCQMNNLVCQNPGTLSPTCDRNARVVPMASYQNDLVFMINDFRNKVAAGLPNFLPAGRMARISWSNELAQFAKFDVLRCTELPRPCMTSPNFPNIGSISMHHSYPGDRRDELTVMQDIIGSWILDSRYVTRKQAYFLNERADGRSVFRPALLMNEHNTHMGCAAIKYKADRFNNFLLSCTFSTVNLMKKPIYKPARQPGANCKNRDADYSNLCAVGEFYSENRQYADSRLLMELN